MADEDLKRQVEDLAAKNKRQARELTNLQAYIKEKNKRLTAMGWVWCNGGCGSVEVFGQPLDEEILKRAENNVMRMRQWLINKNYREASKDSFMCQFCGALSRGNQCKLCGTARADTA